MYLLYRHPLRGGKSHDMNDPQRDEELMMGEKSLFIEHPTDISNRPNLRDVKPSSLPYADIAKMPYALVGPYLKAMFDRAFIDGLHTPHLRPSANEWETALVKTVDLVQPCPNPRCDHKWFVFDNTTKPTCPFCGTLYKGVLPVLNLYSSDGRGNFRPDNHRLMVYTNQYLYQWHASRKVVPNEKLTADQRKPVGYFVFHEGKWLLINQTLAALRDVDTNRIILPGSSVELTDGKKLLLNSDDGGRLIHIQMVKS
jgi:hypothetical protein